MCCVAGEFISKGDSDLSIYNIGYEEIWNSEYMLNARRAMSRGIPVRVCERCYQNEKICDSLRLQMNKQWLPQSSMSPREICQASCKQGWRVKAKPIFLQLNMGNLCNLACRMCGSEYSSRISADPVHRTWAPAIPIKVEGNNRFDKAESWWSLKELMFGEILSSPKEVHWIIFQGGEPFINKEFGEILDYLIKTGAADNITIEITSNMTKVSDELFNQLKLFKRVLIGCSIDGIGEVLTYIRYPARWDKVKDNLKKFAHMQNITLQFCVAVQAYNLMIITDLYRYCDEHNIEVYAHFLALPSHLHVLVLPISARKIALERLQEYIKGPAIPRNIASAKSLIDFLEQHADVHHVEQIERFMLFTNDLDISRNQSFSETYPELFKLFSEAGFPWIRETLHVKQISDNDSNQPSLY